MPKYFENELPLPFRRVSVTDSKLGESWLKGELTRQGGKLSLCLRFEGFEKDCLGYVFNIEQEGTTFRISDITGRQLLIIPSLQQLVAMVLHVSGSRYDSDWQAEFQELRNRITS